MQTHRSLDDEHAVWFYKLSLLVQGGLDEMIPPVRQATSRFPPDHLNPTQNSIALFKSHTPKRQRSNFLNACILFQTSPASLRNIRSCHPIYRLYSLRIVLKLNYCIGVL